MDGCQLDEACLQDAVSFPCGNRGWAGGVKHRLMGACVVSAYHTREEAVVCVERDRASRGVDRTGGGEGRAASRPPIGAVVGRREGAWLTHAGAGRGGADSVPGVTGAGVAARHSARRLCVEGPQPSGRECSPPTLPLRLSPPHLPPRPSLRPNDESANLRPHDESAKHSLVRHKRLVTRARAAARRALRRRSACATRCSRAPTCAQRTSPGLTSAARASRARASRRRTSRARALRTRCGPRRQRRPRARGRGRAVLS
jgi:hypothetical protein